MCSSASASAYERVLEQAALGGDAEERRRAAGAGGPAAKKPSPARSFISVVSATFQPLPTPPTTFASGMRASSMNSSLNSASPVIWRSGRTWTLVLLHVHQEVGEALVLGRVRVGAGDEHAPLRVLRAARPYLLAGHDPVVAVLDRARLQRREVRAGVGLGEALAPDLLARRGSGPGSAPSARRCPTPSASGPPSRSPSTLAGSGTPARPSSSK